MNNWQICLFLGLALLLNPSWSPIQPASHVAPTPRPAEGILEWNSKLEGVERHFEGLVDGPEDILEDADGNLYCSNADGTIRKLWRNGTMTVWATTGGRPLGLEWLEQGELMVVCDAFKGLLSARSDGSLLTLSTESDGNRFRLTDNADVSKDGVIYFTDASLKFGLNNFTLDALESRPHGRLLRYNMETKSTESLLEDLYFANGVALSQEEDFVLVAETTRYRIMRYFISGPKSGTSDIFYDNLPGFPDNIIRGDDGLFWIGIFMPRLWLWDIIDRFPSLKAFLARLPSWMWQHWKLRGMVIALDSEGNVLHFLTDAEGKQVQMVTAARLFGDNLVLGSLAADYVGILPWKDRTCNVI